MASKSYDTETLHLMLRPESIAKANKLAALKRISLDELFVNLVLAEREREQRAEKTTSKASP